MNYEPGTPEYYRAKAKESRDAWAAMDCKQMTVTVPTGMEQLYRGRSFMHRAERALELIRANVPEAIEMASARRPRVDIKFEEIDVLQDRNDMLDRMCRTMTRTLRQMRKHRAAGQDMELDSDSRLYHFAVEWALNFYLKGLYDTALYHAATGKAVDFDEDAIDLDSLMEYIPHVL